MDTPKTRVVEYSQFGLERSNEHSIPSEPNVNLYSKLTMDDFYWEVDHKPSAKYSVVCQFRKSPLRLSM